MKGLWIAACCWMLVSTSSPSLAEHDCRVTVPPEVAISGGEFSLADLLPPDACPALRLATAQIRLGRTPRAGSLRVFTGGELRMRLEKMQRGGSELRRMIVQVPDRVVVRSAGPRLSCAEIGSGLFGFSGFSSAAPVCGAGDRVPADATFEAIRRIWDPAHASWNVTARCRRPADCVPFLLQIPEPAASELGFSQPTMKLTDFAARPRYLEHAIIRPGQNARLLWEQNGVRLTIPVVCLDAGGTGEIVRARLRQSSRVLRAEVIDGKTLRAISLSGGERIAQ